jgi:hypothetical protein
MRRVALVPSLAGLLLITSAGCAHHASDTVPAGAARAPAPAKTDRDTVPDKIASQREAAGLHQNEDDQRWGIGPAQERKEQEKQKAAAQGAASSKAINVTGAPTPTPPPSPATTP